MRQTLKTDTEIEAERTETETKGERQTLLPFSCLCLISSHLSFLVHEEKFRDWSAFAGQLYLIALDLLKKIPCTPQFNVTDSVTTSNPLGEKGEREERERR